jgi:glycosyltransferase involved in cell wall biosynthesis
MRIGIDARVLQESNFTGIPHYAHKLIKSIIEQDKRNEYVLFYNYSKNISARLPRFAGWNESYLETRIPNKILNYAFFKTASMPKLDKKLKCDIFFMPHFNFIAMSDYSKLVLAIHDLSFLRYAEYFSFRKNIWHKAIGVKKLIKKAGKIIAVSQSTKNDIIELCGLDEQKIIVILPGISHPDSSALSPETGKKILAKYRLPENFILFLGTLEPRKNIIGLIHAYEIFCALREHAECPKLVIAGGKGWNYSGIFEAASSSRLSKDIIFTGYIDENEKKALYGLAELFVFPSFYEGIGLPVLEAMAAGTPVIASANSSIPEIAGSAALLIDPYDPHQIARAFKAVLEEKTLRERMIELGKERAKKYDWRAGANNFLNIVNNEN